MIRLCRGCWTSGRYVGANSDNSVHENRMQENINVFDFTLTDKEMEAIEALDTGKSLLFSVPVNQLFCLTNPVINQRPPHIGHPRRLSVSIIYFSFTAIQISHV